MMNIAIVAGMSIPTTNIEKIDKWMNTSDKVWVASNQQ